MGWQWGKGSHSCWRPWVFWVLHWFFSELIFHSAGNWPRKGTMLGDNVLVVQRGKCVKIWPYFHPNPATNKLGFLGKIISRQDSQTWCIRGREDNMNVWNRKSGPWHKRGLTPILQGITDTHLRPIISMGECKLGVFKSFQFLREIEILLLGWNFPITYWHH